MSLRRSDRDGVFVRQRISRRLRRREIPRRQRRLPAAIHAVVWAAYERRIFQKYGLDGEYLALESGTPAMQAMLANELQIVFTTGALAITANLQGADTTIIAGGINFIPNKCLFGPRSNGPRI